MRPSRFSSYPWLGERGQLSNSNVHFHAQVAFAVQSVVLYTVGQNQVDEQALSYTTQNMFNGFFFILAWLSSEEHV